MPDLSGDAEEILDALGGGVDAGAIVECLEGAESPEALIECLGLPDLDAIGDLDIPGLDDLGLCVDVTVDAEVEAGVQLWQIVADLASSNEVVSLLVAKASDSPVVHVLAPVANGGADASAAFELETSLGAKLEAVAVVSVGGSGLVKVDAHLAISCTAAEDLGGDPGAAPPAPAIPGTPTVTG